MLEMTASGRRLEEEEEEVQGGAQPQEPWVLPSRELGATGGGSRASVWSGELRISNAPVGAGVPASQGDPSGSARWSGQGGAGVAMFLRISLPSTDEEAVAVAARPPAAGAASRHPLFLCAENYITLLPGSMPSRQAHPIAFLLSCLLWSLSRGAPCLPITPSCARMQVLTRRACADFVRMVSRGVGDERVVSFKCYLPPSTLAPPRYVAVSGFNVEHRVVEVCWRQ